MNICVEVEAMAHNRELSEKPLVSLEAGKLLGMSQVAKVSTGGADGASRDPGGSAGGAAHLRAGASRLLSKIGPEIGKIGVGEMDRAAVSREEMSRLLSKIGVEVDSGPAVSREEMSRLLSKISETPIS